MTENSTSPDFDLLNIIKHPYVTEKTFNMIERENKLTFIVDEHAKKTVIKEAMRTLYETEADKIYICRGLHGKKAIIRFKKPEGARDLATRLGIV
jgi:large subunit ribosomal protein L23